MADVYEVLTPEYTIHRKVGDLIDPVSGNNVGSQNGRGATYVKGETIRAEEITPDILDALEDENHPSHAYVSKRLKKASGDPQQNLRERLGLPFDDYDSMDEADVLAVMRHLPSAAIQRVKEYEAQHGEGREEIVNYSIGFGESPVDRQEGRVSSDRDEPDENKAVRRVKTREVPEKGVVEPGEGFTGTGDPQVPHGAAADEEDEEGGTTGAARSSSKRAQRRSRRDRSSESSGSEGEEKNE